MTIRQAAGIEQVGARSLTHLEGVYRTTSLDCPCTLEGVVRQTLCSLFRCRVDCSSKNNGG